MGLPPTKEIAVAAERGVKGFFGLVLRQMQLTENVSKQTKLIEAQADKIEALRARCEKLEAREGELLARVEAAALKATADLSGRLGRIEGRLEGRDRKD